MCFDDLARPLCWPTFDLLDTLPVSNNRLTWVGHPGTSTPFTPIHGIDLVQVKNSEHDFTPFSFRTVITQAPLRLRSLRSAKSQVQQGAPVQYLCPSQ